MEITEPQLQQFQKLYLKHYGVELSEADAHRQAMQLLTVMEAVYHPIPKKDFILPTKR